MTMNGIVYHYRFARRLNLAEVQATLQLALVAAESLHGATRVRLDATHAFNRRKRTCVIAAGTTVGRDLNRLFAGFVAREFGTAAMRVEHKRRPEHCQAARAGRRAVRRGSDARRQ